MVYKHNFIKSLCLNYVRNVTFNNTYYYYHYGTYNSIKKNNDFSRFVNKFAYWEDMWDEKNKKFIELDRYYDIFDVNDDYNELVKMINNYLKVRREYR